MKLRFWQRPAARAAGAYFTVWLACVLFLVLDGGNFAFPIASLLLFGILLTGAAICLTRNADAPPVPVVRPKAESLAILAYLVIYTFVLFGPVSGLVKSTFPPGQAQEMVVLAYKILVHLVLPALLIRAVHGQLRGIVDMGLGRRGVVVTMIALSAVMILLVGLLNSLFDKLGATGLSPAAVAAWVGAAWIWMALEAGVCEEFLFRALLQSRLTAWSGSAPMAIVLTAVIFALVHVPAFYLRGGEAVAQQASSLPQIIALSVAALGPIAVMLGVLWHRTRSFLLVVVVHGAIDTMPKVEEMILLWS